jgi:putative transposase
LSEDARGWGARFVTWYNTEHRHSAIRFVTPGDRHFGRETALPARRHEVYPRARVRHPERWSRDTRNWTLASLVRLAPSPNLSPTVQEMKRIGCPPLRDNDLGAH